LFIAVLVARQGNCRTNAPSPRTASTGAAPPVRVANAPNTLSKPTGARTRGTARGPNYIGQDFQLLHTTSPGARRAARGWGLLRRRRSESRRVPALRQTAELGRPTIAARFAKRTLSDSWVCPESLICLRADLHHKLLGGGRGRAGMARPYRRHAALGKRRAKKVLKASSLAVGRKKSRAPNRSPGLECDPPTRTHENDVVDRPVKTARTLTSVRTQPHPTHHT